jgi:hypothetical protein
LRGRIRSYQERIGIASEVEAARRLLNTALAFGDTADIILRRLRDRYDATRNLREAAADALATHPAITSIAFPDGGISFVMRDGTTGEYFPKETP